MHNNYQDKEIIDISLSLSEKTITYPGETPFERVEKSGETTVSSKLTLSTHSGTHVDAPSHAFFDQSVDQFEISHFVGDCRVVDATTFDVSIPASFVESLDVKHSEKILFKTQNSLRGFDTFREDFAYLDGDTAELLATKGVSLVGIDYISIKQFHGKDQRPHTAFLEKGIPILEGINLSEVEPGEYTLIALPLKIKDGDGSPTRAILLR